MIMKHPFGHTKADLVLFTISHLANRFGEVTRRLAETKFSEVPPHANFLFLLNLNSNRRLVFIPLSAERAMTSVRRAEELGFDKSTH